jgi:hypothetical protein
VEVENAEQSGGVAEMAVEIPAVHRNLGESAPLAHDVPGALVSAEQTSIMPTTRMRT